MNPLQQAILKTIAYHSLFQYPLTTAQIQQYLIGIYEPDTAKIRTYLSAIPRVKEDSGRWYLRETAPLSPTTITHSWKLIHKAQLFCNRYFRKIPYIKCVAISGSTAALNAKPTEDIDLFIITQPSTQWIVRTILLTILQLTGERINLQHPSNQAKFCANLILEGTPEAQHLHNQDIYTAMETAHLKVIYDPDNTFTTFVQNNTWIQQLLPNFYATLAKVSRVKTSKSVPAFIQAINSQLGKVQQHNYERKHKKMLTLQDDWVYDHRQTTIDRYQQVCKELGLE